MNERIKELAEQANKKIRYKIDTHSFKHIDDPDGAYTRVEFDKEKFAELIVKEMCDMMEQCEDDCYSVEPSERPTEYIEWLYAWRTRFEKHFGVEE